jgi:hypothetical protein
MIFNLYKVDINMHPTLTSLSFRIFLTHYLPKLLDSNIKLAMLSAQVAKDIKLSYTGGATTTTATL